MKSLKIYLLLTILAQISVYGDSSEKQISRDYHIDVLINQIGYMPEAGKFCVVKGEVGKDFEVVDLSSLEVVYRGELKVMTGDFGRYGQGDFTAVKTSGRYFIQSGDSRSYPFSISKTVYEEPIERTVSYFSTQRCGPSLSGYLAPCHVDDGIRKDNGKHQDVSGGWHDASDLRKWVAATIYGMVGLGKTYELRGAEGSAHILDELRWGNRYFLNMQEPEGYVMDYIGGDVEAHSDSNRWTDNEIGEAGGELHLVKPTAGESSHDMFIFGDNDDRVIATEPVRLMAQFSFVSAEAMMARFTKQLDRDYSQRCLDAAQRCFEWAIRREEEWNTGMIGTSIEAAVELYKATGSAAYEAFAVEQVRRLRTLQMTDEGSEVRGFYFTSETDKEPFKQIWQNGWEFHSICSLLETFPDHSESALWTQMISSYAKDYLSFFSKRNNFGIVPYGLYDSDSIPGDRKAGAYMYRYFMRTKPVWWVGINANITSAGVGLMRASRILNDPELAHVAQRQLDWIVGVNPFNSSTFVSYGYNHPKHFGGTSFLPNTPVIPGAVLNGLGGDKDDNPIPGDGGWRTCEYWTPMIAYTQWLMAEMTYGE